MLKTIREKLNAFLLFLENFGETKFSSFKSTYDMVVSFILIMILLTGIFSFASFVSVANLVVLAVIIAILVAFAWFYNSVGGE